MSHSGYLGPRFLGDAPLAPRLEGTPTERRSATSCHTACAIDASAILEGLLGYGRRSSCTGDYREGYAALMARVGTPSVGPEVGGTRVSLTWSFLPPFLR